MRCSTRSPPRLREHAGRLREELQGGRARLTTIEREALEKSGAKPIEARVRERKAAFDAADRKLANARAEFDKIEQACKHRID